MSAGTQRTIFDPAASPIGQVSPIAEPSDGLLLSGRFAKILELMIGLEFLAVCSSAYLASAAYHFVAFQALPPASAYLTEALAVAAIFSATSLGFRHGSMLQRQELHSLLWSGVGSVALALITLLTAMFLMKTTSFYSRGAFIFQLFLVAITVCVVRGSLVVWLRFAIAAGSVQVRRAVLIGDAPSCAIYARELESSGVCVAGTFRLPREGQVLRRISAQERLASHPIARQIVTLCRAALPDDILLVVESRDLHLAAELAQLLSTLPCDIHVSPVGDIRHLSRSQAVSYSRAGMTLRASRRPLTPFDRSMKRLFDAVVASLALVMLSPLLVLTALAIKLDSPGKVLFRQKRHGYNNEVFEVYKFRTMSMEESGQGAFKATSYGDSRVTNIGRILRQTNIDELPQLLNVVFGQMSLVGPRPHAIMHNKMFEDEILPFAKRHNVKPGITGWAQVNGFRGPAMTMETMRRRVEHDLYYIDHWSFIFDLKIILMTIFSKTAYKNAF